MQGQLTNNHVELRAVHTLLGKRYYIPSYQRGYRWTTKQVTQLLDDLLEFESKKKGEFYCLQPIVVVPLQVGQRPQQWQDGEEPVYEVIDGQQRLTTILLILQYMKDKQLPLNQLYELSYQTRIGSSDFLNNIRSKSEEEAERNSDYWHIYHAYRAIDDWFTNKQQEIDPRCQSNKQQEIELIYQLLISNNELNNVRIIWYELGQSEDKIDVFSRLNIGKIPLTNAELIKALFLRRSNFADNLASLEQVQIASEWDSIENKLQNSSFWTFVSGCNSNYPNHIELIFDLIAGSKQSKLTSFEYYTEVLNALEVSVSKIWLEVKQVFLRLEEWYDNHELYHYIGYLTSTGSSIREIYQLSFNKSKAQFVQALKKKIKDSFNNVILDDLEYEPNNLNTIRKVLILFNIEAILSSSKAYTRFPFDLYLLDQWDVEHIRSRTEYSNKLYQESVLRESVSYFESKYELNEQEQELLSEIKDLLLRMGNKKGDAYQQDFKELFAKIQKYFGEDKDLQEVNGLGNLTLLDSKTNRSYGNSPFVLKRQRIVQNDKEGVFTPIATKNVFLKYYSHHATDILVWQDKDAEDYMQSIQELLSYYFPNQQPE